jgi:3-oxoacyl-[acyl-carrier protein] reductase
MMPLTGRRAAVTGASSGIGHAIALALAGAGADVVVNYRQSAGEAAAVVEAIEHLGRRAWAIPADVSVQAEALQLVEAAWQTLEGIDIWINNAGADIITGDNRRQTLAERLEKVLAVDVRGTAYCGWAAGERMAAAGGGVIVNIGWDKAWSGMEGHTAELFALSKAAVMGFTKSLARSLAPAVRVNCIAPGWIQTAWGQSATASWQERVAAETPLGRWGTPADVAAVAVFLCSDAAAFLTGQILNVNGGVVM